MSMAESTLEQKQKRILAPASEFKPKSIGMKDTAVIILGGGQGTRLFPLTMWRCKPAICFGGRYRLIDVPISNAINSGSQKIFVITQFLSSSLHQHLFNTYQFDRFKSGFIELLPAEERPAEQSWFQGTADAVRKNIDYFIDTPADYFLILSGDQLYHMDFNEMLARARETDADLTLAVMPIDELQAKRMGVMKTNEKGIVTHFREKPQTLEEMEPLRTNAKVMHALGAHADSNKTMLGSLGIYLFKRESLLKLLKNDPRDDFGKHLIPSQVEKGGVATYVHNGYWEDIGTIQSFYEANIALTGPNPTFSIYSETDRLYGEQESLPGPKIQDATIHSSVLCEGTLIDSAQISNSLLGPRTRIGKGCVIDGCYIMGHDFYKPAILTGRVPENLSIGDYCTIRKAIIDKHVSIGNGVQLINKDQLTTYDSALAYIRDGIIVIPKGVTLPDGFVL